MLYRRHQGDQHKLATSDPQADRANRVDALDHRFALRRELARQKGLDVPRTPDGRANEAAGIDAGARGTSSDG